MTVYRIAKWKEVFERAESRKLKTLTWIAMPVGFQSNGYQLLLDEFEDEAAAMYGCWCALASYAASCTIRGTLANGRGLPLKISHVARTTGLPCSVFERLIAWASTKEVGWLEIVDPSELEASIASANPDFPSDFGGSGESPDDPPTPQGNPPSTQPNPTQPNLTKHNPTSPNPTSSSTDGRGTVVDGWDLISEEEVGRQCAKLSEALGRVGIRGIEAEEIWRWGWISERLMPGMLSEIATRIRAREIKKPKGYIEAAIRNACETQGVSSLQVSAGIPPIRREPAHV